MLISTTTDIFQSFPLVPTVSFYLGEAAHLIFRDSTACSARSFRGFWSICFYIRPDFQIMHPLAKHARQKEKVQGRSKLMPFIIGNARFLNRENPTLGNTCLFCQALNLPWVVKQLSKLNPCKTLLFTCHSFPLQAMRTITEILRIDWTNRRVNNGLHTLQHFSGDLRSNRDQIPARWKNVIFTTETKFK